MDQFRVQDSVKLTAPEEYARHKSSSTNPAGSETSPSAHVPIRMAIFSAVLLPMVLAPYLLTRRRTLILRRKVDELQNETRSLRLELDAAVAKLSARKVEAQDTKIILRNVMVDASACRRDVSRLLVESRHARTQMATLRALGSSLADVAAFIHEAELQLGLQPLSKGAINRVDRLRMAALRLQNLSFPQQPANLDGEEPPAKESKPAGGQST